MSSEDFEELRVEEFAMDGEPLRSPLVLRLLNGRSDEDSAGHGIAGTTCGLKNPKAKLNRREITR